MTRKAALNILTEAIERCGGAGTGIRPRPPDALHRKQIAEALRKLSKMVYRADEGIENRYPMRIAQEIDPKSGEENSSGENKHES